MFDSGDEDGERVVDLGPLLPVWLTFDSSVRGGDKSFGGRQVLWTGEEVADGERKEGTKGGGGAVELRGGEGCDAEGERDSGKGLKHAMHQTIGSRISDWRERLKVGSQGRVRRVKTGEAVEVRELGLEDKGAHCGQSKQMSYTEVMGSLREVVGDT